MKILEYPVIPNNEVRCEVCGCKFLVTRNDLKKRGNYNCTPETGEVFISMFCPCCKHMTVLNRKSPIEEILQAKYEEINKIFRNKAVEISKSDLENRQEVFRIVDDLFNEIIDIEK